MELIGLGPDYLKSPYLQGTTITREMVINRSRADWDAGHETEKRLFSLAAYTNGNLLAEGLQGLTDAERLALDVVVR